MLEEILRYLNNWFVSPDGIMCGRYTAEGGGMSLPLSDGQYFRVRGSVFNDGVYRYPPSGMTDETFTGEIWAMNVPKAVLDLCADIEAWQEKNAKTAESPYDSESFGGYSYSRAKDEKSGGAVTWRSAFRGRLNAWRKI